MTTTQIKDDLHQIIDQIEDQAILEAVRTLLAPQVSVLYHPPGQPLDQDRLEDLLEESEADIEVGNTISQIGQVVFINRIFDSRQDPDKLAL